MGFTELGWDGGFIMAASDKFDEGIEWYTRHMGWKCTNTFVSNVGKMAFLRHPMRDHFSQVVLKSFESDYEHFQVDHLSEGQTRLCFSMGDPEKTLRYFQDHDIETTNRRTLPDGRESFNIHCFEGTILTAVHDPDLDEKYPDARLIGFDKIPHIIGVSDLSRSVKWYEHYLGYELTEENNDEGYAWMSVSDSFFKNTQGKIIRLPILLEQLPKESEFGKANPSARGYHYLPLGETFDLSRKQLIDQGLETSEIAGDSNWWGAFHFFDPDGNRINVWTYKVEASEYV